MGPAFAIKFATKSKYGFLTRDNIFSAAPNPWILQVFGAKEQILGGAQIY
jgi:hypothetical protein